MLSSAMEDNFREIYNYRFSHGLHRTPLYRIRFLPNSRDFFKDATQRKENGRLGVMRGVNKHKCTIAVLQIVLLFRLTA